MLAERSVIFTNALISGNAPGKLESAVCKYNLAEGFKLSEVTFTGLLVRARIQVELIWGRQIHLLILRSGISIGDEFLAFSCIEMYFNSQIEGVTVLLLEICI